MATLLLLVIFVAELFVAQANWSPDDLPPSLPTFSPPGGYYERDVQIRIEAPGRGWRQRGEVIFSVDARLPTPSTGTRYERPIRLSTASPEVTVIHARTVSPDGELGPVVSASYFVGVETSLPLLSLAVDPDDLWNPERGMCANPHERGEAWERPVDVTFVDADRRSGFHISAGLRVHGGMSRGEEKKSFRLYFRGDYGASRLEFPLFEDGDLQSFKRLILHTGGRDDGRAYPDSNWTLMRNQIVERLTRDLNGPATRSRAVLMFINGEPWGIYHLRERIDRFFLADHYGLESFDLLTSPENAASQEIQMGDREHWDHLMAFVETHDLAQVHNYVHVETQVDLANMIDYFILQIYAANADWPHDNVHLFRPRAHGGCWHWIAWDCDDCFGADVSSVDTDMIARVLQVNHPETGGRDTLLLRKLLENPAFRERFLARTATLLNTVLAPQSVVAHVDDLAAELWPDIAYEAYRQPGASNWEANVAALRRFALHRPDFVRQHVVERFRLPGTALLTIDAPDEGLYEGLYEGIGSVAVDGAPIGAQPWRGVYFQDVPIQVTAIPAPGYRFAGWEPLYLPQTPRLTLELRQAQVITPCFEQLLGESP